MKARCYCPLCGRRVGGRLRELVRRFCVEVGVTPPASVAQPVLVHVLDHVEFAHPACLRAHYDPAALL